MALDVIIDVNSTSDGDDEDFTNSGSGDYSTFMETTTSATNQLPQSGPGSLPLPLTNLTITIIAAVVAAVVVCILIVTVFYCRRKMRKGSTRETVHAELATSSGRFGQPQANNNKGGLSIVANERTFQNADGKGRRLNYDSSGQYEDSFANDSLTTEVHLYEHIN